MFLINKIKKLLGVKEVPRIESIQTYEDVDLFLKNYKHIFTERRIKTILPFMNKYWTFTFEDKNKQVSIIEPLSADLYIVFSNKVWREEPNIKLFIWDNKDEINKQLLANKQTIKWVEKEFLRRETLDEEIKNKEK